MGDPHFIFHHDDNEKICFNYNGNIEHPMLLIGDAVTGLYITGKLEKAGKGTVFKEITIMTPEGVVVVFGKHGVNEYKNEKNIKHTITDGFQSHDLIIQNESGFNNWNVKVGNGIQLSIERRYVRPSRLN